jgi:hypothetical protein
LLFKIRGGSLRSMFNNNCNTLIMESNELRMGNWVLNTDYQSETEIEQGWQIEGADVYYEAIPLTKDRLRHFKFEKDKSNFINDSYVNKDLEVTIIIREDKFFLTSFFGWIELQYVHKMQNLCFELTGKELTL